MEKIKNSFIPIERGALPRILLLDCDEKIYKHLSSLGYNVVIGSSGFCDLSFSIEKHESEIEGIIWDISKFNKENELIINNTIYSFNPNRKLNESIEILLEILFKYFKKVKNKGGFISILMGDSLRGAYKFLPHLTNEGIEFKKRLTSTIQLNFDENDYWGDFFKRFIIEHDIKFNISLDGNQLLVKKYFEDEDKNFHAVVKRNLAIIPKISENKKQDAITFLLEEVLPYYSNENIFPNQYKYLWTNEDEYKSSKYIELKKKNQQIINELEEKIDNNKILMKEEEKNDKYLLGSLISDDSSLFSKGEKLSDHIHKIFDVDLGFNVTDIDEKKLELNQSLKEDKWIKDDDNFFALLEIKGTEKGAKANWIRKDLNAHIKEFETNENINKVPAFLVFNHERRVAPKKRNTAFKDDPGLLKFCEKSKINLIPVYELFKMVRDVRKGVLSKKDARNRIKKSTGLFIYSLK
jgi:hypothetical protein